jgi:hypothetical protein
MTDGDVCCERKDLTSSIFLIPKLSKISYTAASCTNMLHQYVSASTQITILFQSFELHSVQLPFLLAPFTAKPSQPRENGNVVFECDIELTGQCLHLFTIHCKWAEMCTFRKKYFVIQRMKT